MGPGTWGPLNHWNSPLLQGLEAQCARDGMVVCLKEGSVAAIRDASRDVFLLLRYGSKGRSKGKDRSM